LNCFQITGISGEDATRKPPLTIPGKANGAKIGPARGALPAEPGAQTGEGFLLRRHSITTYVETTNKKAGALSPYLTISDCFTLTLQTYAEEKRVRVTLGLPLVCCQK
jgi:hypothetical protein